MVRETSVEAYRTIKENGLLSRRRWEAYEALFDCGPATATEVFNHMTPKGKSMVASNVRARLGELRDMGCVKEVGEKVESSTGATVILWDVTRGLPAKYEKPKKKKCPHCRGRGYTEEVQAKLF